MSSNRSYIPWIIRSKILEENRKYFFFIAILNLFIWVICGIKADIIDLLVRDPSIYFTLPSIIYAVWAANFIIKYYIKIFSIDIHNSTIVKRESKEFRRIKNAFEEGGSADYQQELLKLICNKNEKLFIVFGSFIVILAAIIHNFILTKDFGTMYNINVYPWTLIAHSAYYIYWYLFISPLLFSLLWVFIGILRGIKLIGDAYHSKLVSWKEAGKIDFNTISLKGIEYDIKPILDLIYKMSSLTIVFSFIYVVVAVVVNIVYSMPILYFFSLLVVGAGLAIFIWPQISLHRTLENAKGCILLKYYSLYENKKSDYLNNLKESKDDSTAKDNIGIDLFVMRTMIIQAEEFNTWPYFYRIYTLVGAGLGPIVPISVRFFVN